MNRISKTHKCMLNEQNIKKTHSNFTFLYMKICSDLCTISNTYKGTDTECEKLIKMPIFFTVLMVIFVQLEIPG